MSPSHKTSAPSFLDNARPGDVIRLRARPGACARTRAHLRERGPAFRVGALVRRVPALAGALGLFVQGNDGWDGWLPLAEVEQVPA
jgi:hypothetical protein